MYVQCTCLYDEWHLLIIKQSTVFSLLHLQDLLHHLLFLGCVAMLCGKPLEERMEGSLAMI